MERKKQIIESKFPPSNKEVIWLDSSNNTIKKYINGSWQPLIASGGSSSDEPGGDTPSVPEEKLFTLKGLYSSYVDYISDCLILSPDEGDVDDWRPENLFPRGEYGEIGKLYNEAMSAESTIYINITKDGLDEVKFNATAENESDGDIYTLPCFTYTNESDIENLFEDSDTTIVKLTKTIEDDYEGVNYNQKIVYKGDFIFKGFSFTISIDVAYNFSKWPQEFPIFDGGDPVNCSISEDFKPLNLTIETA